MKIPAKRTRTKTGAPKGFDAATQKETSNKFLQVGDAEAPTCEHGPALLFERQNAKGARPFWACAACRGRKVCPLFHWADERPPKKRRVEIIEHEKSRDQAILDEAQRARESGAASWCHDCEQLFPTDGHGSTGSHKGHNVVQVSEAQMKAPTTLLRPLDDDATNAQYFFSDESVEFLASSLLSFSPKSILCLGSPRCHEILLSKGANSFLLDLDMRMLQFHGEETCARFNIFNGHFMANEDAGRKALAECDAIIVDPPFSGPMAALGSVYESLGLKAGVKLFFIFPYFQGRTLVQAFPKLKMTDYAVEYANHAKFKERTRASAVRLFTTVDQKDLVFPSTGYRFCTPCQRYVAKTNVHCEKCNACTGICGRPWKHCDLCGKCVKPGSEHCKKCGKCHPLAGGCRKK